MKQYEVTVHVRKLTESPIYGELFTCWISHDNMSEHYEIYNLSCCTLEQKNEWIRKVNSETKRLNKITFISYSQNGRSETKIKHTVKFIYYNEFGEVVNSL